MLFESIWNGGNHMPERKEKEEKGGHYMLLKKNICSYSSNVLVEIKESPNFEEPFDRSLNYADNTRKWDIKK